MKRALLVGLAAASLSACGINLPTAANEPTRRVFRGGPLSLTNENQEAYRVGPSGSWRGGPLSITHTDSIPTGGRQIQPAFGQSAASLTDVNSQPTSGTGVQAQGSGSRPY